MVTWTAFAILAVFLLTNLMYGRSPFRCQKDFWQTIHIMRKLPKILFMKTLFFFTQPLCFCFLFVKTHPSLPFLIDTIWPIPHFQNRIVCEDQTTFLFFFPPPFFIDKSHVWKKPVSLPESLLTNNPYYKKTSKDPLQGNIVFLLALLLLPFCFLMNPFL